jgi:Chromo (CHRromatin Organisation MOdifier) domain
MPYNETEKHSLNFLEPPPDLIDGEEEWEIEEILGDWHYWHKKQYLVQWKGYALAHDSWVDESELHVPELLEAYKNKTVRRILTNPAQLTMADIPQPAQIPHDQSSPVLHQSAVAQVPQDQSLWETGLQKYYELLSIRTLQLEDKETSSPTSFSTGRRSLFPRWAPSLLPPFRTVSSSTQQI